MRKLLITTSILLIFVVTSYAQTVVEGEQQTVKRLEIQRGNVVLIVELKIKDIDRDTWHIVNRRTYDTGMTKTEYRTVVAAEGQNKLDAIDALP